ncbi:hypothetical protein OHB26_10490 [Nocardia sp. NBC_01503]|uniref:hypothetical protein n=1 Tax=Nocardia sp. NBC_01503 TaxID=2975997 RepID=UPI002E7B98B6|nr:hypothetical protein [Nocardia sp. NBC_01503]WTL34577.1 hypothetical protein OHB26_10490 [Nocardia sp. NBC_01503]
MNTATARPEHSAPGAAPHPMAAQILKTCARWGYAPTPSPASEPRLLPPLWRERRALPSSTGGAGALAGG